MATRIVTSADAQRPDTTPLKSSVLAHAAAAGNVVEKADFGMRNEEGLWPSYNCLDTLVPTELCPEPLVEPETREPKEFSTAPWIPGFNFAVYGGVQCNLLGLDTDDQHAEVERVFLANEGRGIEKALLGNRFVARADDPTNPMTGSWDAPVDITPASAITLPTALALLEGYAATVYAGVPTIHMPRAAASLLGSNYLVWEGDLLFTRLGSKVAIGGGYDGDPPYTGVWDLYATGEVYVEKSKLISVRTYELLGSNPLTPFAANTGVALAERMFRAAVDCFVAKATGSATSTGGFGN